MLVFATLVALVLATLATLVALVAAVVSTSHGIIIHPVAAGAAIPVCCCGYHTLLHLWLCSNGHRLLYRDGHLYLHTRPDTLEWHIKGNFTDSYLSVAYCAQEVDSRFIRLGIEGIYNVFIYNICVQKKTIM